VTSLVRTVAANLSLGTQLETAGPVHPYTFFSAKTAVTFIRLRALIWRCHPDPLGALAGGRNEGHPPFRNRRRATSASLLKRHAPVYRTCLLLALSGHAKLHCTCPLSGVKRTSRRRMTMSDFDPKRTFGLHMVCVTDVSISLSNGSGQKSDMVPKGNSFLIERVIDQ